MSDQNQPSTVEMKPSRFNNFMNNNSQLMTTIVFSLLCSLIVLTLYIFVIAKRIEPQIGSVDVQSLMKDVTISTFKNMTASTDPDKQTQVAAENIKIGAERIEKAIAIVSQKHNLILIQKQAFGYDKNIVDYTSEVKNEINTLK